MKNDEESKVAEADDEKDEADKAAREAKREADAAAREAKRNADKAFAAAQDAFKMKFIQPILDAITTGDWLGSAQRITALEQDRVALTAEGEGLDFNASDVLGMIAGMRGDLEGALNDMVELGYESEATADMLREYFSPTIARFLSQGHNTN